MWTHPRYGISRFHCGVQLSLPFAIINVTGGVSALLLMGADPCQGLHCGCEEPEMREEGHLENPEYSTPSMSVEALCVCLGDTIAFFAEGMV